MKYLGIVQKGIRHGTQLGFPTINIPLADDAVSGIYAATVACDKAVYRAAVYADQERKILEAHIIEECPGLAEKEVSIELFEKIRDDREFADEGSLKTEIARDIERVRAYFSDSV